MCRPLMSRAGRPSTVQFSQRQRVPTDFLKTASTSQKGSLLIFLFWTSWALLQMIPKASDAIKQLQVHIEAMDNSLEYTLATFTNSLVKLGVTFRPLLPYLPQENGKVEHLNRMLGDMAREMMVQSGMPVCFWRFAYCLACFLHNRIPNLQCVNSLPHQELFGTAPSIATLYPFGADAISYISLHQEELSASF
ncbi:hypothetical protein O181_013350 [Austropuccinia psidii MF-1]|uniref:Integrase catalytic domain-containing protein n=1 Tax=Austropuccinia psidii MF-1 TaxID=1389203 RepID=A0A9Q3GNU4_9BASI|nr:hypothetical protein [Austropuccinia psidii MF-1]